MKFYHISPHKYRKGDIIHPTLGLMDVWGVFCSLSKYPHYTIADRYKDNPKLKPRLYRVIPTVDSKIKFGKFNDIVLTKGAEVVEVLGMANLKSSSCVYKTNEGHYKSFLVEYDDEEEIVNRKIEIE